MPLKYRVDKLDSQIPRKPEESPYDLSKATDAELDILESFVKKRDQGIEISDSENSQVETILSKCLRV